MPPTPLKLTPPITRMVHPVSYCAKGYKHPSRKLPPTIIGQPHPLIIFWPHPNRAIPPTENKKFDLLPLIITVFQISDKKVPFVKQLWEHWKTQFYEQSKSFKQQVQSTTNSVHWGISGFILKTATPWKKVTPFLPSYSPLKIEILSNFPLFENLVGGSKPQQKGGQGAYYSTYLNKNEMQIKLH